MVITNCISVVYKMQIWLPGCSSLNLDAYVLAFKYDELVINNGVKKHC